MASSKIKIANIALTKLSAKRITAFSDDTEEAKAINAVYDDILEEVLVAHPWSFAQKRHVLATLSITPVMTEDNMTIVYAKPSDLLKITFKSSTAANVKVESNGILSDTSGLKIIYTMRATDSIKYFPAFTQALATRLASEIAVSITQSLNKASAMLEDYEELKLPRAKAEDSKQSTAIAIRQDEWLNARQSGIAFLNARTDYDIWHPI